MVHAVIIMQRKDAILYFISGVLSVLLVTFCYRNQVSLSQISHKIDPTFYHEYKSFYEFNIPTLKNNQLLPFGSVEFPTTSIAFCFMSPKYDEPTTQFAQKVAQNKSITVFILIDSVTVIEVQKTEDSIYLVSYDQTEPQANGFYLTDGFNVRKEVHSWGKVFYIFSREI